MQTHNVALYAIWNEFIADAIQFHSAAPHTHKKKWISVLSITDKRMDSKIKQKTCIWRPFNQFYKTIFLPLTESLNTLQCLAEQQFYCNLKAITTRFYEITICLLHFADKRCKKLTIFKILIDHVAYYKCRFFSHFDCNSDNFSLRALLWWFCVLLLLFFFGFCHELLVFIYSFQVFRSLDFSFSPKR